MAATPRPAVIGTRIRKRRKALGLNQTELGRRVGAGQNTVSGWETGLYLPAPAHRAALAIVLGVDSGYLYAPADLDPAALGAVLGIDPPAPYRPRDKAAVA